MAANGGGEIIGRADERARLREALGDAATGRATVVVVDGEAGMGKTTLLRSVLVDGPARVLAVSGDEAESDLPRGIVDQIVRLAGSDPVPAGADALGVGTAVTALMERLAADGPLVIVVDDGHWADDASLRALTFAARHGCDLAVAVVVACRTDGLDRLPAGLVQVAAATGGQITLAPLGSGDIEVLAERAYGRRLPPGVVERLRAHAGGNPLHTLAVLREVPYEDAVGGGDLPAPRSYATFVLTRLAGCSPEARDMAAALAVLGRPSSTTRVAATAAVPADRAAGAAAELAATGLVAVAPGADGALAFAHGLVHASLAADLSPSRRSELHARAATATRGDERLRHRLAAAAAPDDRLVAEARRRADLLVAEGAPARAARLLLAASPVAATAGERQELVVLAASHLLQAGQGIGALAGEIEGFGDSARRSLVLGREALVGGRPTEAKAWLERAWAVVQHDPDAADLVALVADMLAMVALDQGRWPDVTAWADRAVTARSASGISATLLAHGLVLSRTSERVDDRLGALVAAADTDPVLALDARVGRGIARLWRNDLDGAEFDLRAATGLLSRRGSLLARAELQAYRAEAAFRAGRWDEAVDLATATAWTVDEADAVWLAALSHGTAAVVLAARGDRAGAERHLVAAEGAATATGLLAARLWAHQAALRVAAAAGDHLQVARLGDGALDEPWSAIPEGVHHWRAVYVEALLATGRVRDAARVAVELAVEAEGGDESVGADAARAAGAVAGAEGRDDDALAAFAGGLALDPGRSRPFERALLELAAGAHLRRSGRRRAAMELLTVADERLRGLGAAPWVERCRREVDGCGLRPRRRSGDDDALTARERLVAEQVARGLTNREVSGELGISVKTVEHHLGRVYAKLGVRSRSQLVHRLSPEVGGVVDLRDGARSEAATAS